jgi:hypothetical protein
MPHAVPNRNNVILERETVTRIRIVKETSFVAKITAKLRELCGAKLTIAVRREIVLARHSRIMIAAQKTSHVLKEREIVIKIQTA